MLILATLEILISSAIMLTEAISGQIIKVPACPTMPLKKQTFSTSSLCSQCIIDEWIVVIFPVDIFAVVIYALLAPIVKVKTSSDDT